MFTQAAQSLSARGTGARARVFDAALSSLAHARASAQARAGQINIIGIIGAVALLVFYMVNPEPIHHFIQWVINAFIEAVRDAFGTSSDGGSKDPGQIRTKHGPGSGAQ